MKSLIADMKSYCKDPSVMCPHCGNVEWGNQKDIAKDGYTCPLCGETSTEEEAHMGWKQNRNLDQLGKNPAKFNVGRLLERQRDLKKSLQPQTDSIEADKLKVAPAEDKR